MKTEHGVQHMQMYTSCIKLLGRNVTAFSTNRDELINVN